MCRTLRINHLNCFCVFYFISVFVSYVSQSLDLGFIKFDLDCLNQGLGVVSFCINIFIILMQWATAMKGIGIPLLFCS